MNFQSWAIIFRNTNYYDFETRYVSKNWEQTWLKFGDWLEDIGGFDKVRKWIANGNYPIFWNNAKTAWYLYQETKNWHTPQGVLPYGISETAISKMAKKYPKYFYWATPWQCKIEQLEEICSILEDCFE